MGLSFRSWQDLCLRQNDKTIWENTTIYTATGHVTRHEFKGEEKAPMNNRQTEMWTNQVCEGKQREPIKDEL